MPILILVRHGQSIYNLENRFTGGRDILLTELGQQEARQAGVKLKGIKFDIAYTSVLKRAIDTLTIILDELHQKEIPIVSNAALNERGYGSLEGLDKAQTAKKYGVAQVEIWRRSYDILPPDGESLEGTYKRVVPFYKTEVEPKLKAGENVLIVAHGNSLRSLMMYLESIGHREIVNVNILTGIPRRYDLDDNLKIIDVKYL